MKVARESMNAAAITEAAGRALYVGIVKRELVAGMGLAMSTCGQRGTSGNAIEAYLGTVNSSKAKALPRDEGWEL